MSKDFFPPRPAASPTIYAYEDTHPEYKGLLKVGYTIRTAAERVAQQYPTAKPGKQPYTHDHFWRSTRCRSKLESGRYGKRGNLKLS